MKKLLWGGILLLAGWIGIIGMICASAMNTYNTQGITGFLVEKHLLFMYLVCWILFLYGLWICIYQMYLKKLVDGLEVEKK